MNTHLSRTRLQVAGGIVTLAAAVLGGTASAQAAGETSAVCAPTMSLTITPGFSPESGSGTLTSDGETGSLICTGTLRGHHITSPGSVGLDEAYTGADCLGHVGTGTATVTLPTTGGVIHMSGAATSHRTALAVVAEVDFPDASFNGVGVAIPTHGTCLLTPLRQATISLSGLLGPA